MNEKFAHELKAGDQYAPLEFVVSSVRSMYSPNANGTAPASPAVLIAAGGASTIGVERDVQEKTSRRLLRHDGPAGCHRRADEVGVE